MKQSAMEREVQVSWLLISAGGVHTGVCSVEECTYRVLPRCQLSMYSYSSLYKERW